MVKLARVVLVWVAVVLVAALGMPRALGQGWYPPPPTQKPTPPSDSNGSAGKPGHATVANCSLYATSSSFGMSCITGGSGDTQKVREILAGDPPPTCWDVPISEADLASKYGYTQNPNAPYYLHSCLTGLDLNSSLYWQPNLQLNQKVIEIPANAPKCKQPFTQDMENKCVMWLTANQQKIVSATVNQDGQIPGITMTFQPSTTVRTNLASAYVDAATDASGNRITRTPDYKVGRVTMWAQMTAFKIYPYGPNGESKTCAGTEWVAATDTPESKPEACWWTYPASSARQRNNVYPFRAEADWTVYYSDGATTKELAHFRKYDDLELPVYDVQTLVVPSAPPGN